MTATAATPSASTSATIIVPLGYWLSCGLANQSHFNGVSCHLHYLHDGECAAADTRDGTRFRWRGWWLQHPESPHKRLCGRSVPLPSNAAPPLFEVTDYAGLGEDYKVRRGPLRIIQAIPRAGRDAPRTRAGLKQQFGCGDTPAEAIANHQRRLQDRIVALTQELALCERQLAESGSMKPVVAEWHRFSLLDGSGCRCPREPQRVSNDEPAGRVGEGGGGE